MKQNVKLDQQALKAERSRQKIATEQNQLAKI
jgi:hypothetical protein